MSWIAGVDGCKVGWVVAFKNLKSGNIMIRIIETLSELLDCPEKPKVVVVDIPIGLMNAALPGGRECDRACRKKLPGRASSVFSAPVRACLRADSYEKAKAASRNSSSHTLAISKQTYAIIPKIREVDELMISSQLQNRIFEGHPELSFTMMNETIPMEISKRRRGGKDERRQVLSCQGYSDVPARADGYLLRQVAEDDILDAYAMLWTAERKFKGTAERIPDSPSMDSHGLRMEMWY